MTIDVSSYKENGFFLAKHFFAPEEVERVRGDAKAVFIAQMLRLNIISTDQPSEHEFEHGMFQFFQTDIQSFTNCGKQAQHLISLHRLSLDDRIISGLRELGLKTPNISTRPLLYFNSSRLAKKEVYWRLAVHQDWRSMQGSLDAVVVWIALADIDRSLGTLEVIPKSHKWGLLESEMTDGYGKINEALNLSDIAAIDVQAGDALFFSTFLVHRSGTNVTDSIRWSCHFRYNNLQEATFIERGFPHPYIYKPQETLITDRFPSVTQVETVYR